MPSAASFQCNICLSLVACIFTIYCVQPIGASIECHKHVRYGIVKTQDGENVMDTCESSSSICYESYLTKTSAREKYAIYKAGCSECTPDPDEECRTCNTPLCNDVFVKKIRAKNRQCIIDGDENSLGSQTVYCAPWVIDCYHQEYRGDRGVMYHAGCGKGMFDPPDPKSRHCSTDLCNVPSSLKVKMSAQRHLKKLPMKISDTGRQDKIEAPSPADTSAKVGKVEAEEGKKIADKIPHKPDAPGKPNNSKKPEDSNEAVSGDGSDEAGQLAKSGGTTPPLGDRKKERPRGTNVTRDLDNSSATLSANWIAIAILLPAIVVFCFGEKLAA